MIYIPRGCNNCGGTLYRHALRQLDGQRLLDENKPYSCGDCYREYRRIENYYVETPLSIFKRLVGWNRGI